MNYRNLTSVRNIFLTGATGVFGARLLQEILSTTDACVYCLSREESVEKAQKQIEKLLFVYDEEKKLSGETWRIIPVLGDLSKDKFGLDDDSFDELATTMELVFHSAANVSLIASYEKLSVVNVEGTKKIIDFCLSGNTPLLYVSSFSVIGDNLYHDFTLMEDDLDVEQGFEEMGYEKSKFDAESALHTASEHGLNWAIIRPGNIWGDEKTGCYPLFETKVKGIYYEMIKSLVEMGYTYSSDEDFDISPASYVAEAALYIALNIHNTNHQTYHLTSTAPITYNDIVDLLTAYGYTIRKISDDEYFEALYEERFVRDGAPYRSTFTDLLSILIDDDDDEDELDEQGKYDTSKITQLLQDTDIKCPASDLTLMSKYLDYAVKRGWISSPDKQSPLAEITEEIENKILMEHLYDMDFEELDTNAVLS